MKQYAVIVAGGSGTRMGGGIPKQFRSLCGRPLLWWSMKAFHEENRDTELILVLPSEFINLWQDFFSTLPDSEQFEHRVTSGGASRSESVRQGLALIKDTDSLVAIHDAARPFPENSMISAGWEAARQFGAATPVVPVTDSLRKLKPSGNSESVDRADYVAVQTPQVFRTKILKKAYEEAGDGEFTDDASLVEKSGVEVKLIEGSYSNIKITNPKDLAIASVLIDKNA